MKNKILVYGRFLIAVSIIVLSLLAFGQQFYPLPVFAAQFTAAVQSGILSGIGLSLILLAILIIITLLFGRIYCSTLCPLGLYQEILTILFKPFYKKRKFIIAHHGSAAYWIAVILFGTLLGGSVALLRLFDPYSIAGNALSGAWFGLGFVGILTILVFFKKRFFCTDICPVGAILGLLSRFSLFKIHLDANKCKMCSLCARSCPCGSIDYKNHTINNETCIKCFKCLSHCRHGALYYGLSPQKTPPFDISRRRLLKTGVLLAALGIAWRGGVSLSRYIAQRVKNVILPAGSRNPADFANRCLNCNLCVQNCPQQIIKPATADIPFVHIEYGNAYCDFNCHKCSTICPSGAIRPLTLKEKRKTKIATAAVNEEVCIKCGLCAFECPKQVIIKEEGEFPLIRFDGCIGCGKCAAVCPVKAITLETVNEQKTLSS